jgi:import inner membrane translocase subunit TIM16
MVKRYIIQLLFEHGPKVMRSFLNAYKDVTKDMPKGNKSDESFTSKMGFQNLLNTPMTKNEALKILNIKEDQMKADQIMQQFDKYMEANDPEKGGSFYIQNKVYYAKEFLMEEFDPELNVSKHNPDGQYRPDEEQEQPEEENKQDDGKKESKEEDITDKDKKI